MGFVLPFWIWIVHHKNDALTQLKKQGRGLSKNNPLRQQQELEEKEAERARMEHAPNLKNPVSDLLKLDIARTEVNKLNVPGRHRYSLKPEVVTYGRERDELENDTASFVPEEQPSDARIQNNEDAKKEDKEKEEA